MYNYFITLRAGVCPSRLLKILRIMRLSFLLILAALMQVSAATLAQKISLKDKDIVLEQALKNIGRQAGFSVFYNEDLLTELQQHVAVNADGATVEDALKQCFKQLPLTYVINGKTILVIMRDNAPINTAPCPGKHKRTG